MTFTFVFPLVMSFFIGGSSMDLFFTKKETKVKTIFIRLMSLVTISFVLCFLYFEPERLNQISYLISYLIGVACFFIFIKYEYWFDNLYKKLIYWNLNNPQGVLDGKKFKVLALYDDKTCKVMFSDGETVILSYYTIRQVVSENNLIEFFNKK